MVVIPDKMDLNRICEDIISDITGKTSISEILLKTQLLAAATKIEAFQEWVSNEQNGYKKPLDVPEYRRLHCNVTALLSIPFHAGQTEMNVPIDAIQHKEAQKMFSTVFYDCPAVEAERLALASEEACLRKPTPAIGHKFVQPLFPNAHLVAVFQDLSPSVFASLIDTVKSKILGFIIQLDKDGIINLTLEKSINTSTVSKVFYQTFHDSVVNNGEGNINSENIMFVSQNSLTDKDIQKLRVMFSRLNVLVKDEQDPMLQEAAQSLKEEINSAAPKKSVIKKGLAIIKGLAMGVASNEITTIINAALGILQN